VKRSNQGLIALIVVVLQVAAAQDSVDVTFRYTPPGSPSGVYLVGEFNGWNNQAWPMTAIGNNTFSRTARLAVGGQPRGIVPGAYEYKFYYAGVTDWPNDPLNHLFNPNDNNDSYVYVGVPTIYQLVPNERTGAVTTSSPTISAYLFPKVGGSVDTGSITLKVGVRNYSGLGRFYNPGTRQFSYTLPDHIPNGTYKVIFSAGSSADSVSMTVQAGFIQITNNGGFVTRNPQRTLFGAVTDTSLHDVKLVRNESDTTAVTASLGAFSATIQFKEGLNTIKAIVRDAANALQVSDPVSFTYVVNHAPEAGIYFIGSGANVILSAQGIDPDSGQTSTFLWAADGRNPQQLAGVSGSKSKQIVVAKPTIPGEYYLTLIATDPDGNKDTTRSFFTILEDGTFQGSTLATVPGWVKRGRVYEMFFKSFTPQGTINAAIPMLPYLKNLGVNILWIMPIMENAAPINNGTGPGYNIKNFLKVAPEYGTNDDFKNFVLQAHNQGLKVVLDVTPNHTSYMHPFVLDARQFLKNSQYWNFYQHTQIPHNTNGLGQSTTSDGFVYYSGFSSQLLNYNWSDIDARAYMIEVYKWWVRECDIDGYRFDVYWGPHRRANGGAGSELEMGIPVRKALKKLKPDIYLLAEDDGTGSGTEVIFADRNGGVDAGYDWVLYGGAIKPFFFDQNSIENLHKDYFNGDFYPGPNASFLRFMENHDEERIVYQYLDSSYQKTKPMATTVFTVPGMPMIYSGQEVGFGLGLNSLDLRRRSVIDWNAAGKASLLPHYQRLANIRGQFSAFSSQKFVRLTSGNGQVYAYARPQAGSSGVVAVNFSPVPQDVTLSLSSALLDASLQDGKTYFASDLYNDTSYSLLFTGGNASLHLSLKAYGSSICVVSDSIKRVTLPSLVSVEKENRGSLPSAFTLHQNYPNPFNPSTTVTYELPSESNVTVRVYNILGEAVITLVDEHQQAGSHMVQWNGLSSSGFKCSSGVYFLHVDAGGSVGVKRMLMLK
jgi:cyclomaltodextrinase / maltogenic alpha-amylase / neopullulanase